MKRWIQTYSGVKFYPLNPRAEDVRLVDIAHHLSNLARYNGATSDFYSVAQHSVLVSHITNSLVGLLHDAAEAYLNDMAKPLKYHPNMLPYRRAEGRVWKAIAKKFGLRPTLPRDVHEADLIALVTERRDLFLDPLPWSERKVMPGPLPEKIVAWSPGEAEVRFLERAKDLGLVVSERLSVID